MAPYILTFLDELKTRGYDVSDWSYEVGENSTLRLAAKNSLLDRWSFSMIVKNSRLNSERNTIAILMIRKLMSMAPIECMLHRC